ncbi:hypothetical protein [Massilia timonae]|uniref:hypothetical protein n=1 Tax=Massilia timonae TaxID=47229 RepID=UPI0028D464EE|nr:hypothetical protein [Massilia timonae]
MIGPSGTFAAPKEHAQTGEFFSVEQASQHAAAWCAKHPAWLRICDLGDIDGNQFYVQWHELSARDQKGWGSEYAYNEFAIKAQKVEMGFISGKGEFYSEVLDVPPFHNLMQVIRVGVKTARAVRSKKGADHG